MVGVSREKILSLEEINYRRYKTDKKLIKVKLRKVASRNISFKRKFVISRVPANVLCNQCGVGVLPSLDQLSTTPLHLLLDVLEVLQSTKIGMI